MIRRTAALVMAAVLAIAGLGGCAGSKKARSDKMQIVCTIFPAYDWTKTLLGSHEDEAEITYLQSDGSDLHSYEPSAKDLALISECDLFIFVGGESDSWSADAVKNAKNKKMKKIDLLEVLGSSVKDNSLADELDSKESEEEGSGSAAEGKAKEEPVHDEHVWLSPRNAEVFCNKITNALCELDQLHE
ncbi:MAG: zinc ABC transporter substrate-binding protein, partial [Ruminococcus sp.]|nr:zinc ABC transporter substrate-binding protein [Ruminococcus sp.]